MHYFIAFQILCGCFSAYVARRKGLNPVSWGLAGALLPVFGVVLAVAVSGSSSAAESLPGTGHRRPASPPRRPRRCCGSYLPDCFGCPFFRRQLFARDQAKDKKGYCEYYRKDLVDESRETGSEVHVEDA